MCNTLKAITLLAAVSATLPAMAQQTEAEGKWLVRARVVHVDTANKSTPIAALAVPGDAIHVSNKTIPEIDISYFITKNLATELILTYPQKHNVDVTSSAIGGFKAGSFKLLPPTLTLQWHFNPDGTFRPYVGAGITYSRFSSNNLSVPGVTRLHLENDGWGGALQAGFDVKLSKSLFLNFDVKKAQVRSDLFNNAGTKLSLVKVDPLLIGIGLGWRF